VTLKKRVGLAALDEYEVAVAVVGGQDRLEVERLALMLLPDLSGHDDEARRRVAKTAVENRRLAVEIKE
jgi:hypothetical protein